MMLSNRTLWSSSVFFALSYLLLFHTAVPADAHDCDCYHDDCGCCGRLDIHHPVKIDADICANLTFLPKELGIDFTLTVNNDTLINKTVSLNNPPPICVGFLKVLDLCVDFYNISITKANVTGCVQVEVKAFDVKVATVHLGCFHFNLFDPRRVHMNLNSRALEERLPELHRRAQQIRQERQQQRVISADDKDSDSVGRSERVVVQK